MKKTVVIHQPDFFPYIGFFHRLLHADLFVILDDVQFLRRGWHHRDKIKTNDGTSWITIEIQKSPQDTKINEIVVSGDKWKIDHLRLIEHNYKKAQYYNQVFPYIKALYSKNHYKMIDFNLDSIHLLMNLFNISVNIDYSSEYGISDYRGNEYLVEILKRVDATHYLSGIGAKDYYDPTPYKSAGIDVVWQSFQHPVYPQLFGNFIPYLSSIDLLFNCGIEKSREIIRSC